MLSLLQNWNGTLEVNGISYNSIKDVTTNFKPGAESIHIIFKANQ